MKLKLAGLLLPLWVTIAAAQPAVKLAISRVGVSEKGTVSAPVLATTDSLMGLAQFVIEYDSTIVRLASPTVNIGSTLSAFAITAINQRLPFRPSNPGANKNLLVQISGGGNGFFSGNRLEVLRLNFQIIAAKFDSTPIYFDRVATHTFLVTANLKTINGGLIEFASGMLTLQDTEAPAAFDLLLPPDSAWTRLARPPLQWSRSADAGSGLAKYQLFIDGTLNREALAPAATSTTPKDSLPDGLHQWYVQALDSANNVRASGQTWTFRVDRTPPRSEILQPRHGAYLNDSRIMVEGGASDHLGLTAGIGVAKVLVSRDGGQTWLEASNTGAQFNAWKIVFSGLANGVYLIKSKAVDLLGNEEIPGPGIQVTLGVDNEPPEVFDLVSPPDSSWTNEVFPTFHWNPSRDALSGLAQYQLFINGILYVDRINPLIDVVAPRDTLPDGEHRWQIHALDNANNSRASTQAWLLRLDRTPPTSEILRPRVGERFYPAEIVIEGIASDRHGEISGIGVRQVLVSTDRGVTWVDATNSGVEFSTWRHVWKPAVPGNYILQSQAIDKFGQAEVVTKSVTISIITSVDERATTVPTTFAVSQNYPNPLYLSTGRPASHPFTEIALQIPQRQPIALKIFNLRGELVATLMNEVKPPGFYTAQWDGRNASGQLVGSGVYFYRMTYGAITQTRKLLVVH